MKVKEKIKKLFTPKTVLVLEILSDVPDIHEFTFFGVFTITDGPCAFVFSQGMENVKKIYETRNGNVFKNVFLWKAPLIKKVNPEKIIDFNTAVLGVYGKKAVCSRVKVCGRKCSVLMKNRKLLKEEEHVS